MERLDLHGQQHDLVEDVVVKFIYKHHPPFEIITGKSKRMRELVEQIVIRHGFESHLKNWTNHGSLIIVDGRD
jgi:hypothetical protein